MTQSAIFDDLIIFEMANNHQGSLQHGLNIIRALAKVVEKYKIHAAIKFQYRDLDTIIHPDYFDRKDVKNIPRFLSTRLTASDFYKMVQEAKKLKLVTMCTPFDEQSVDLLVSHNIDIIKVASCSSLDWPLLEKIATANKPTIISTGAKSFVEMDKIYNFFLHRHINFALLHCVGLYPVHDDDVQLNAMKRMMLRYPNIPIGYSGHENPKDMSICKMAIACGAKIVERHVGMKTDTISLNAYSTDVNDIEDWIKAILSARAICGGKEKVITQNEKDSMNALARGTYAARDIRKGESIKKEDIFFAIPVQESQLTSGQFKEGLVASQDYAYKAPIFEKTIKTQLDHTREIIHEVKGILSESGLVISNEHELELSHHYGIDVFRDYGATIVNIINREYCKKIIIMLPGQKHPVHYHKSKEESFQILSGVLTLTLDGVTRDLYPGDLITVKRNSPHAFSSIDGCVFEEISTTHIKNDSYYDDPRIMSIDIIKRKTKVELW